MTESQVLLNPLEKGLGMEGVREPCAMVIIGAHGDLTKRKLIPALYALYKQGLLPAGFCVVGMSRTQMTDEEFRKLMRDSLTLYGADKTVEQATWDNFASLLYYLPVNFSVSDNFAELTSLLVKIEQRHETYGNRLFYLACPPSLYEDVTEKLYKSGLTQAKQGLKAPWPRIVIEKPFGRDLQSAIALSNRLREAFREEQIFRIDHYLGKETVQNIMVLRFANGIFEPLWNRQHVDHIQITNAESIGVEDRGAYYEEAGNLRDMIQNHMLQLVSLVSMEPPISLEAEAIRNEKVKVLKSIRPIPLAELPKYAVRGQYGAGFITGQPVVAYREEKNVSPNSCLETLTALKLFVDNWRWADVPFYVRSGKRLAKSATEIAIYFKRAPHRLFSVGQDSTVSLGPNVLVLKIQPDEGVSLKFAIKQPGSTTRLRWISMDFRYGTVFGVPTPSAYERLVHDCILGDTSLFARTDALEASWEIITPILEAWQSIVPEFPNYAAGSWGPQQSDDLLAADGRTWRSV